MSYQNAAIPGELAHRLQQVFQLDAAPRTLDDLALADMGPFTDQQKVIDYLVADWGKDYSITCVDIAMAALKLPPSDEIRFRIGNHIKAHPELHEVIRRWGWVTLVLTPNEKLIARTLINAEREGKPQPTVAEIAKAVGIPEAQTDRGLAMLERYEILQRATSKGAGYKVVARYIKWEISSFTL